MNVLLVVKIYGLEFGNLDDPVQSLGKLYDTNLNDSEQAYKIRHQRLFRLKGDVERSRVTKQAAISVSGSADVILDSALEKPVRGVNI